MKAILFISVLFSFNVSAASLQTALSLHGLQWAQIADTRDFYIPDVYEVCGNTGAACSGTVNGQDLTGWRWASQNEVNTLISDFFAIDYTAPENLALNTASWFDYFTQTGHEAGSIFTIGLSSDVVTFGNGELSFSSLPSSTAISYDILSFTPGDGQIFDFLPFSWTDEYAAFFDIPLYDYGYYLVKGEYTPPLPPSEVPLPASLFLFAPAVLGFMGLRRKKKLS